MWLLVSFWGLSTDRRRPPRRACFQSRFRRRHSLWGSLGVIALRHRQGEPSDLKQLHSYAEAQVSSALHKAPALMKFVGTNSYVFRYKDASLRAILLRQTNIV